MTNTSPSLPQPEIQNTRFSVVIRVAFFVALVIVSRFVVTVPLLAVFGAIVAASVGLYLAGILANLPQCASLTGVRWQTSDYR